MVGTKQHPQIGKVFPQGDSKRPLYSLVGGHLTLEKVTFSSSQKGHDCRIARPIESPGFPRKQHFSLESYRGYIYNQPDAHEVERNCESLS